MGGRRQFGRGRKELDEGARGRSERKERDGGGRWRSLIETHVDIKTTDNYVLRLFCIGFTKKRPNARRVTWYAKSSQLKQIRRKMVQIMTREASNVSLRDLVEKLYARVFFLALLTPCSIPNGIGKQIERECQGI